MVKKNSQLIEVDGIDKIILNQLSQNARISVAHIAKIIGVSATAVHQRITKLENNHLIKGSKIEINEKVLGYTTIAFIGIYLDRSSSYQQAIDELSKIPEILEAHFTTGNYSVFAKILCKDNDHLMDVLNGSIQKITGIIRTETIISLDQKINRTIQF